MTSRGTEGRHRAGAVIAALALAMTIFATPAAAAASKADYTSTYTAAVAAEADAGKIRNQWTSTEEALHAAKKAGDAGKYDDAVREAALAEAMARRSIEQAAEQKTAWHAAVIGADAPAEPAPKKPTQ